MLVAGDTLMSLRAPAARSDARSRSLLRRSLPFPFLTLPIGGH